MEGFDRVVFTRDPSCLGPTIHSPGGFVSTPLAGFNQASQLPAIDALWRRWSVAGAPNSSQPPQEVGLLARQSFL
jgi:hypothetical protein